MRNFLPGKHPDQVLICRPDQIFCGGQCTTLGFDAGLHGDFVNLHGDGDGLHLGLLSGAPLWIEDDPKQQSRWLLTLIYILAWEWVLAGIVQGQIVDAYARIREEYAALQADTCERCLVCSLERFTCDRSCGGFELHITEQHNPLMYLFFFYYLHHTPSEDQDGMEYYTAATIEVDHEYWIPISTCAAMEVCSCMVTHDLR